MTVANPTLVTPATPVPFANPSSSYAGMRRGIRVYGHYEPGPFSEVPIPDASIEGSAVTLLRKALTIISDGRFFHLHFSEAHKQVELGEKERKELQELDVGPNYYRDLQLRLSKMQSQEERDELEAQEQERQERAQDRIFEIQRKWTEEHPPVPCFSLRVLSAVLSVPAALGHTQGHAALSLLLYLLHVATTLGPSGPLVDDRLNPIRDECAAIFGTASLSLSEQSLQDLMIGAETERGRFESLVTLDRYASARPDRSGIFVAFFPDTGRTMLVSIARNSDDYDWNSLSLVEQQQRGGPDLMRTTALGLRVPPVLDDPFWDLVSWTSLAAVPDPGALDANAFTAVQRRLRLEKELGSGGSNAIDDQIDDDEP